MDGVLTGGHPRPAYDEAVRLAHWEAFAGHWGATPPDPERWQHRWIAWSRRLAP